jgi:hypothetical protein
MIITETQLRREVRSALNEIFNPMVAIAARMIGVDSDLAQMVYDLAHTMSRKAIREKMDELIRQKGGAAKAYEFLQGQARIAIASGKIEEYAPQIKQYMEGKAINTASIEYADSYIQQFIPYPIPRERRLLSMVEDVASGLDIQLRSLRSKMQP